jgi:hypothetical protein
MKSEKQRLQELAGLSEIKVNQPYSPLYKKMEQIWDHSDNKIPGERNPDWYSINITNDINNIIVKHFIYLDPIYIKVDKNDIERISIIKRGEDDLDLFCYLNEGVRDNSLNTKTLTYTTMEFRKSSGIVGMTFKGQFYGDNPKDVRNYDPDDDDLQFEDD